MNIFVSLSQKVFYNIYFLVKNEEMQLEMELFRDPHNEKGFGVTDLEVTHYLKICRLRTLLTNYFKYSKLINYEAVTLQLVCNSLFQFLKELVMRALINI